METSKAAQAAPKTVFPKPPVLVLNPNQSGGRQLFLQKKPVVIRLEKNGKVIDATTNQTSLKRSPESFQAVPENKKVKLEAGVTRVTAQKQQSQTSDIIQTSSYQPTVSSNFQLPGTENHSLTFSQRPVSRQFQISDHPTNRLQKANVFNTPACPQQNATSTNSSYPFQTQTNYSGSQQLDPNYRRPNSPGATHRRQLRFQYYKNFLNNLCQSEQSQLHQAEHSMQVECKAKLTLSEKQDILRKYKDMQTQHKVKLVQAKQLLAKLHHFEKKKYEMLVQKNNRLQNIYYVQQNVQQNQTSGQFQVYNSDQYYNYGQHQPAGYQQWNHFQEQQTTEPQANQQQLRYQWNYEQQQFNPLVYSQESPQQFVPVQQNLRSPNLTQQIPVQAGSFTSSPQSAMSGYSPQSSTSLGYHSNSDDKLSPNMNQTTTNRPLDLKDEFGCGNEVSLGLLTNTSAQQDSDQSQLLDISSSQLFNSSQQFDFNQDQLLDIFTSDQPGAVSSGDQNQTTTEASNDQAPSNKTEDVKAEPVKSKDLWEELLSIIND